MLSPHPHNRRTNKPPPYKPRGIANDCKYAFSLEKGKVHTEFFTNSLSQGKLQMSHRGSLRKTQIISSQSSLLFRTGYSKCKQKNYLHYNAIFFVQKETNSKKKNYFTAAGTDSYHIRQHSKK